MRAFFLLCVSGLLLIGCGTDFLFDAGGHTVTSKPPGPTGVTATDGTHMAAVRISWNAVSNAASYNVYRSTLPEGGAYTLIGSNILTTQYDDTNAVAFFPYYYKVSWFDTLTNESLFSTIESGFSDAWRAPAPGNLTAVSGGAGTANLSWDDGGNTAAATYTVYYGPGEQGPYLAFTNTTGTTASLTGLPAGETTWFRVVALDAGGNASLLSGAASLEFPPDTGVTPPGSLTASWDTSQAQISLSWAASPDAASYRIFRSVTSSNGAYTLVRNGETTTAWNDTTAPAGQEVWYRVTAVNGSAAESLPGGSAAGWRTRPAWTSATFPAASDGTLTTGIHVSWLPVPGASAYAVYRADTAGGSYSLMADNLTTLSWLDESTTAGTTRYYKIVAIREDGARGPLGAYDAGFRAHEGGPPMPTGVNGHLGDFNEAEVAWNNMGTTGYRVWEADNWHGPWTQVYDGSSTSYKDSGLEHGSYYRVACRDASGRIGPWSDPVEPAAWSTVSGPQGLTASTGNYQGFVQLGWAAPWGATKNQLWRAPTPSGPWTQIADLDDAVVTYSDSVSEGYWYYKIRANNLLYTAAFGEVVLGYPAAVPLLPPPGNPKAINENGGTQVRITWSAVNDASGYVVHRAREENGLYAAVSGTVTGTEYTDTGRDPATTYYYKMVTLNALGKPGELSASCNNRGRLDAPAAALATDGTLVNTVTVLWTPVSGAVYYRIFRAQSADGVYLSIGDAVPAPATAFNDLTPLPGTAWYRVAAFDSAGIRGEFSLADSGSARAVPVPNPPTGVDATDGSTTNGVAVSWNPVSDAAYFKVARSETANGDYVFISPPVSNTGWMDTTAAGREYYYKVSAFNADGLSGMLSTADAGYKKLTDMEFLIAYDTTIARANQKLTLMHNSGTDALGQEVKYGDISGLVAYDAHVAGIGADIIFTFSNYCDYYLVVNDSFKISANMSKNGTMSGTVTVSSPAYNGTVRYALIITGGNASGGYWYVSQDGGPETQIPWFPSPSSK